MGFLKKISSLFSGNNIDKDIKWDTIFENENIILTCNKDLNEIEQVNDLINMYNIDHTDNSIILNYEDVYDLYYDEYENKVNIHEAFNLPKLFSGFFRVENKNNFLQDEEVMFNFAFEDSNGKYSIKNKNILSLELSNEYRIMPKKLYELVTVIKNYNSNLDDRSEVSSQFNMLKVIQDYSKDIDIILNKRLSEEEAPIVIDKIKLDFSDNGELLELFPRLSDDESINKELLDKIENYDDVKGMYSVNVDGKKIRFVVNQKESLKNIVKNRYHKGEKRLEILSGASEIFDDENIDFEDFGPRVTGIGYLNYRGFSSPANTSDLDWLDKKVELPYIHGYNINGDSEKIVLKPEDGNNLKEKLVEMNINNLDKSEVTFKDDSGKELKIIMSKDDIKNEIQKLDASIKSPADIKTKKILEEVINICDQYEGKDYIEYNGKYIINYGKEAFIEQLNNIEKQKKENKDKSKSLLISENIEVEEYAEDINTSNQITEAQVPIGLRENIGLFDYQKECLLKLQNLYLTSNVNGFLLCDDMGLGKTLQLLSFLGWLKDRKELKPSLIIAPTSLLNNWDNEDKEGEIQKFFKDNYFDTEKIRGRLSEQDIERLKEKDIVFTTYESLRINNISLGKINWKVMICDEAQKIKSPKTKVTVAAKAQNANFKVICSATPIENSLVDLWNLVDYSKPGLLGSLKEFRNNYESKVKNVDHHELQSINDELYRNIEGFYIRREKDILPKSLPKKVIKIYKTKANEVELDLLERIRSTEESVLSAIQKMLAVCTHVDLVQQNEVSNEDVTKLIAKSSKLKIVKNILEGIKGKDEKVLIFTRSIKAQQILYKTIKYWFNIEASIVNGKETNLEKRTQTIDNFRNTVGFDVIILSPEVAGFGITLTEANHVIHYTRLWNPAKEDQATDRVYRIGQDKEVTVHYPMLSFEEDNIEAYGDAKEYVDANIKVSTRLLSPEEKLNILLARKKNMLLNFFLVAADSELGSADFLSLDSNDKDKSNITFEDIEKGVISPFEFEALIGVLYEKMGYKSYVTSKSNDNGVDVICLKDDEQIFIQCKKVKKIAKIDTVKDLLYAEDTYKKSIGLSNIKRCIVTNATDVCDLGRYDIDVVDGSKLSEMLNKYRIFKDEVDIKDNDRYSFETLKLELK